ncbi:hypothetical protein H696_05993 [Fonticula alba]|uniref:Uncharacterized protein n=1 Tax=Fonticula alba TaxID=691883 RepID=A0A058Z011_FONAL|nr:hypothetical protein H696_05993 [Fonticula alba]KCV67594.1 hypothetical protein H696_05993 [Fonticula alba]|eukprot:XP_009498035.1 hypothetical protein H696_05993 [Fonticula alba]
MCPPCPPVLGAWRAILAPGAADGRPEAIRRGRRWYFLKESDLCEALADPWALDAEEEVAVVMRLPPSPAGRYRLAPTWMQPKAPGQLALTLGQGHLSMVTVCLAGRRVLGCVLGPSAGQAARCICPEARAAWLLPDWNLLEAGLQHSTGGPPAQRSARVLGVFGLNGCARRVAIITEQEVAIFHCWSPVARTPLAELRVLRAIQAHDQAVHLELRGQQRLVLDMGLLDLRLRVDTRPDHGREGRLSLHLKLPEDMELRCSTPRVAGSRGAPAAGAWRPAPGRRGPPRCGSRRDLWPDSQRLVPKPISSLSFLQIAKSMDTRRWIFGRRASRLARARRVAAMTWALRGGARTRRRDCLRAMARRAACKREAIRRTAALRAAVFRRRLQPFRVPRTVDIRFSCADGRHFLGFGVTVRGARPVDGTLLLAADDVVGALLGLPVTGAPRSLPGVVLRRPVSSLHGQLGCRNGVLPWESEELLAHGQHMALRMWAQRLPDGEGGRVSPADELAGWSDAGDRPPPEAEAAV